MLARTVQLYKDAYTGLNKESWYLSVVMFINRSGTMVLPFMTMYCTQKLHYTIAQAGVVMAMFGAGSIAGAFIGGKLTDKFGFYNIQIAALLLGGCLFVATGYVTGFLFLCGATFLLSLCNDAFRPANSSAVATYSNEENRTRSYSLNRLAVNLGWAAGGSIGGLIASFDYHLLFWVDGVTNIVAAILMLLILPKRKSIRTVAEKEVSVPAAVSAYRDKHYLVFIFLTVCFGICFFQNWTMLPVFLKTMWNLNEALIGVLLACNGLIIVFFEMVLIHSLEGKRSNLGYVVIGVLFCGLSFIILNYLPAVAITAFVSIILITFGEMLSMPFMNSFWIGRTTNNNRGEYAALYTMAWSAAQILAPTLGSLVAYEFGYASLWWLITVMCILTSFSFWKLNKSISKKLHGS